jgi:predicted dehydrogenase
MLEKPPGTGVAELDPLIAMAADTKRTLFATWHSRYAPAVEPAREWLAARRILSVHINWKEDVRVWHPGQSWIWEPGGLGVFDPGINALSIATKIFPGPLFVQSAEFKVPENAQTPIAADIIFSSPAADGPLRASLDWRRNHGEEWTITVETSNGGTVRLEDGGATLILDGGTPQKDDGPGEYPGIYRTFIDLIDNRRSLVDVAPFRLVADAMLVAKRTSVDPVEI